MSTSLLYHGLSVRGYRYLKTEYVKDGVVFHIKKSEGKVKCVSCGSREVIKFGGIRRRVKTLPIGFRLVWLEMHLHRIKCKECGWLGLEPLKLSEPKKSWTRALGRYILGMLKHMTIKSVAGHLRMSWDTVKDIHKWALKKRFKNRPLKHLRYLGVDEVAVRKGHRYLTIVLDLESGAVVWVKEGRDKGSLEEFIKRLKRSGAKIKGIAMDMWPPYMSVVLNHYPSSVLVFDHYHVISDYNRTLDALRNQEARVAPVRDKRVYKGMRYLLLRGAEKLESNENGKAKLSELLKLNESLNVAYILKEELREFWSCGDIKEGREYLDNWLKKAWGSGIELLTKFANRLSSHRSGLLNYFKHHITTAKVEGVNNKIKTLKRMAYGFRDMEYFKLRIYALHEATYALIG